MPQTTITIDLADRDALKRYKLSVAGDAGLDIPMGKLIGILVEIGKKHHAEVIMLAQERLVT